MSLRRDSGNDSGFEIIFAALKDAFEFAASWNRQMWMEVAIAAGMFAVGNILFGHFEEGVPKWRRVAKFFLTVGLVVLVSATAGRAWAFALIGVMLVGAGFIHVWWLPRQGINGWTGEPREKYYELRGWKRRDY